MGSRRVVGESGSDHSRFGSIPNRVAAVKAAKLPTQLRPALDMSLDPNLDKLLSKHGVDAKVKKYLLEKHMLLVSSFARLADSRSDVAKGICTPAGLNAEDRPLC